ncbi:MAG TPA: patatin-like phospholipase family protein [Pseudonocardiaceae bacterium]|nr:patatin-like phospholipase family protein [Pseudonocardiaceae bacterium]
MTFALVLAGGGVAGIAWELGVLQGIADTDEALAAKVIGADTIIGTSAGSVVAVQITSGTPLATLYERQLAGYSNEIAVDVDLTAMLAGWVEATEQATDDVDRRRRIGALALAADTVDEDTRRAVIATRLPGTEWPDRDVRITAVDAHTGELVVFTAGSGVPLVDAVGASCAVPGVWPPVTVDGRRYVDGGVRSASNADLAKGADRVLLITPMPPDLARGWGADLDTELAELASARVQVVPADQATVAAFGTNPLDPTTRAPSARAGRDVGRAAAPAVQALFD